MYHINLDRKSEYTLSRQIYMYFKSNILDGTFEPNMKLPSTRGLAKFNNVSRNVVVESYEQLISEGYIHSVEGSGTYVSDGLYLEKLENQKKIVSEEVIPDSELLYPIPKDYINFRTGLPDLKSIPIKKWGKLYKEITIDLDYERLDYQNVKGMYGLRKILASYLKRVRGVEVSPECILITNGAAQAFSLVCDLVDDNEFVLVENPLSQGIVRTLMSQKVRIKPVALDCHGLITKELPKEFPKLIFVTPSHQFPTGAVMSATRRVELIQYARSCNSFIVEDDYDSEFRYTGPPIQSLQSLDPDRVIYIGTFSKILSPAFRLGYIIMPTDLLTKMEQSKYYHDLHSPIIEQLTMARFIEEGFLDRHIRKMNLIYKKRRDYIIRKFDNAFGDEVNITGDKGGMHLVAWFKNLEFDTQLIRKIDDSKVHVSYISEHMLENQNVALEIDTMKYTSEIPSNGLILGYGNLEIEEIEIGLNRLIKVLMDR